MKGSSPPSQVFSAGKFIAHTTSLPRFDTSPCFLLFFIFILSPPSSFNLTPHAYYVILFEFCTHIDGTTQREKFLLSINYVSVFPYTMTLRSFFARHTPTLTTSAKPHRDTLNPLLSFLSLVAIPTNFTSPPHSTNIIYASYMISTDSREHKNKTKRKKYLVPSSLPTAISESDMC